MLSVAPLVVVCCGGPGNACRGGRTAHMALIDRSGPVPLQGAGLLPALPRSVRASCFLCVALTAGRPGGWILRVSSRSQLEAVHLPLRFHDFFVCV